MQGIRVRPLERSDMEEILRLHRSRDDAGEPGSAEKRTELLEWLAFHNPYAGTEATYYVAEENGSVLAFQGRMPVEFLIRGKREKGYYVHDTYVHPDARSRGIGFALIAALAEATERDSDSFFCLLGGTPLNLRIQRRMGYLELPPAPQYVKLLNPKRQLRRSLRSPLLASLLAPVARTALALADLLLLRFRAPRLAVVQIQRFDHRFDMLLERIGTKIGICSHKNSSYLNWKFADRPHRRDTILGVEMENGIAGFAVLGFTRGEEHPGGVVMDLIADPDDEKTIAQLCRALVQFFRRQRVEFIRCVTTDERFAAVLRKFLFFRSNEGKALLIGNLERSPVEPSLLRETSNWHMSLGESDAFMLST